MKALIAVLPGDGIGPEIVAQATRALRTLAERFGHTFELVEAPMGGIAIDQTGTALPSETLELCREGRSLVEFCATELEAVGAGLEELRLDELVGRLENR